jgi:LmbE family N-acetylglucosaminyl deacetylase
MPDMVALASQALTLMVVHAHPDDEVIGTGGTMARYAAEGLRVVCITCTGGEAGEIVRPELDTPENRANLAGLRAQELARALAHLGPIEHHFLGYRDSGMMGTPANQDPRSFWKANLKEATGRLVHLVRRTRPHVLVSYNDFGGYGHPDHIRAAVITKAAFARAGDPRAYPEQLKARLDRAVRPEAAARPEPGEDVDPPLKPWAPAKLYEIVMEIQRQAEMSRVLADRGIAGWWDPSPEESAEQRAEREQRLARMAAAQGPITTRLDIAAHLEAKHAALSEHRSQIGPDNPFLALTPQEWRLVAPTEAYTLRQSRIGVSIPEDDLFAGLH